MGVGLVGHVRSLGGVGVGGLSVALLLLVVVAVPVVMGVLEGLVGTGAQSLLVITTALGSALGVVGSTAADREEPEEAGSDSESGGGPDETEVGTVETGISAVDLSGALDDTNDDDGGSGGQAGGSDDDYGRDTGDEEGEARGNAGAGSEEADEELGGQGGESGDEDNLGPARNGDEGVNGVAHLGRNLDSTTSNVVSLVDDGGVESAGGPVVLGLAALAVGAIRVGGAEAPEVDVVVVGKAEVAGGDIVAAAGARVVAAGDEVGDVADNVTGLEIATAKKRLDNVCADREFAQIGSEHVQRLVADTGETRN